MLESTSTTCNISLINYNFLFHDSANNGNALKHVVTVQMVFKETSIFLSYKQDKTSKTSDINFHDLIYHSESTTTRVYKQRRQRLLAEEKGNKRKNSHRQIPETV